MISFETLNIQPKPNTAGANPRKRAHQLTAISSPAIADRGRSTVLVTSTDHAFTSHECILLSDNQMT
jgi:hypothetical protein